MDNGVPADFKLLEGEARTEVLSRSASRGAGVFFTGDVVTLDADGKVYGLKREYSRDMGQHKKGDEIVIPYLHGIRNGQSRMIPFSAFRTFPAGNREGLEEIVKASAVMRDLYAMGDPERADYLPGKTLKVKDVKKLDTLNWNGPKTASGYPAEMVKEPFPIFEEVAPATA